MEKRSCRRCGLKTVLTQEEIDKAVSAVIGMKGIRLADEETAEARMKACRACERLEYGSTCALCGCLIEVRCRLADSRCPYPKNPKW